MPAGEVIEVSFNFDCWLGVDQYTISLAVHSREGQAYDWLDAALFLRVTSMTLTEGVANLNASATARHRALSPGKHKRARARHSPDRFQECELWLKLKLKAFCAKFASASLLQQRTGQERGATRSAMTNRGNGAGDSEALQPNYERR